MFNNRYTKKYSTFLKFIFCVSLTNSLIASTYIVDNNPTCSLLSCTNCLGENYLILLPGNNKTTLKSAIDSATNDWTGTHSIKICSGSYNESNIDLDSTALNNSIIESVTGNKEDVRIYANSTNPILKITQYISGLTLRNMSIENTSGRGIDNSGGSLQNATFQNLAITSKAESFYTISPQNLSLKDSDLTSTNSYCFYTQSPTGPISIDTLNHDYNTFTCKNSGIYFGNQSQNYFISHTKILTTASDAAAITMTQANTLTIDDVDINSSDQGSGIWVNGTVNSVSLRNSKIHDIKNEAVYFKTIASTGTIFENNVIDSGTRGIYLKDFSNPVTIKNNIIQNTGYGIYLLDNTAWRSSQIDSNCFLTNTNHAFSRDQNAYFDNGTQGNYWDTWSGSGNYIVQNIPRYDNYPRSFCHLIVVTVPNPIAEYRLDECSWNGSIGEVTDSSGNNYYGTLKNKLTMTLETGKVCRAPTTFQSDAYIELPTFPNLTANQTITAWFKTTDVTKSGQRIFQDDQYNTSGYALSVGDGGSGTVRFYDRTQGNSGIIDSDAILQNNTWYFVAGVTNVATGIRYLYVYNSNGVLLNSKNVAMTNTARGIDTGVATIGGEADGGSEANSNFRFSGAIDEVKVFDKALTQSQISTIASNEVAGLHYDGTTRTCNSCFATCFSDDFNRASLGSKWNIISTGTYPPNITDNKLMLTQNRANIASGISLIGSFPSGNNLIEIEFEHNAYAGSGADGVTLILSDANITPVAGGFGGSLGYAPKDSTLGFAGAWLGFGLDEYGNFSNDNDGNKGRGCAYRPNTAILDSVTIRGRGATNRLDGYCFVANSGNLQSATGVGIDTTSSTTPAPKSKYKFIIDTRSGTKITVQRDINGTSGYVTLPNMNEVNATQVATAPDNFRLSFAGSTGGSTNYHSFDDLSIKALSCGTLGKDQNNTSSFFDAWEIGAAYNISNRIIQTKIVDSSFNLNIFALNEQNTAYQDFNGTVCARIVDSNDKNLTGWTKVLFNQASPYVNTATFSSKYVSKDSKVALAWKKNSDTTCPLSVEDNSTKSTDHFAIRPKNFTISTPTDVYAAEAFKLDFKALNASGNQSLDYNESKDSSFSLNYTIDNNSSCALETLNVASFSFENGQKLNVDANYTDVGKINITIAEKNGAEFAKIDATDTSDTSRLITAATTSVHVLPYELNITSASFDASTGMSWLYDANVSDMYVKANATVQANNKNHTKLKNFTALCGEATDVDVTFYYDVNNTNKDINLSYNTVQGVMSNTSKLLADINKTMTIPASSFSTASASTEYRFNIDRSYTTPLSPIIITLKDINVTSTTVAKNENNTTLNQPKTFYYGRIKTNDITTDKNQAPHFLHVEIYSAYPLSGFYQNSLNWWIHKNDGFTLASDVNISAYQNFTQTTPSLLGIASKSGLTEGKLSFTITNPTQIKGGTFHLGIPSWLWYSPLLGKEYQVTGDCSTHPCFEYRFIDNASSASGIKSGTFKGSTIGDGKDFNSTYQKTGVKIFR